ncbi:MAG TPA: hypothetical protein VMG60_12650 [Burkholderiaceae bacterium]|nr:hypothetical protein [Burkholderiaceae bacterium]
MKPAHLFVGACLFAAVLPVFDASTGPVPNRRGSNPTVRSESAAARTVAVETLAATGFRDRPLTQQPLTALEEQFAANFPGSINRYQAGTATLIVREVTQPTRQLHPAVDCFRAAGYTPGPAHTQQDARQLRWSCFEAGRGDERWRICERIANASGSQWTDVSSWYWTALWSRDASSAGPWWAITLVTPLDSGNT